MHEPPDDLAPALVPSLLAQRVVAGGDQLAATLFELVRRGRYTMTPVTREESSFAGLRHKEIDDVDLARGDESIELAVVEKPVAAIFDKLTIEGPVALSQVPEIVKELPRRPHLVPRPVRGVRVGDQQPGPPAHLLERPRDAREVARVRAASCWSGGGLLALGIAGLADPPLIRRDLVITAVGAALALNALVVLLLPAPMWRRRRPEMQASAEQWEGFRHYLEDFPRLADKPADTLPLWERYLIYGITFGIAERVLEAAKVSFPAISDSSVYVPALYVSSFNTSSFASDLGGAFPSPSSGSSGGGGGGGGSFGGGAAAAPGRRSRTRSTAALQAAAVEADAAAQRCLLAGDPAGAGPYLRESEQRYRESWEAAPPGGYGRLVGMLKAAILRGDAAGAAASRSRRSGGPESPTAAYASRSRAWPRRRRGRRGRRRADGRRRRSVRANGRRARGAGRRDEPAYAAALRAVVADFEARDLHLTGVPIADTALVLERLAEARGLAQRPASPLLPLF